MDVRQQLTQWIKQNLTFLRKEDFHASPINDVTAIAYHYRGTPEELDETFWTTEHAFLQTFKTQGVLPSVLVTNWSTPYIVSFCKRFSIDLQIEKSLVPGVNHVRTLCIDLVSRLHSRFDTPYVLSIQWDGFPMRPGLEEFIGKYDYIGAPWVKHVMWYDLYPRKYSVGNGGFSLRSRRLCEIASTVYNKWFSRMPYWWYLIGDDTFYCKTLRFWFRSAVKELLWPTPEEAARFSIECDAGIPLKELPLGFHACGFSQYSKYLDGLYPSKSLR